MQWGISDRRLDKAGEKHGECRTARQTWPLNYKMFGKSGLRHRSQIRTLRKQLEAY